MEPLVTLPHMTDYIAQNVPLTELSPSMTLSKNNGLIFSPMPNAPTAVSDTF